MKVYNTKFLRGNQRFVVALAVGLVSAVVCALAYAVIVSLLHFKSGLFYIAMAYGISYCIKTYGRGVEMKYSVLGAIFTLCSILFGEMFIILMSFGFSFSYIPVAFVTVLYSFLDLSIYGIVDLVCLAYAMYLAYYNSRIV